MALDLRVPFGYRFDPTDEELICCLDWKRIDPNDPRITFIPDIKVNDHEPLEFAGLGTVKGKDSVYFFGRWSGYGKRKSRQVKKVKGKVIGSWEVVSRGPVKIKSSDGTQIGSRTNFIYNVGGPTGWHMEEYCHDGQVSICRVYNKCSQERGTTKNDAKETGSHSADETSNFNGQEEKTFHRKRRKLSKSSNENFIILERFEGKGEAGPSSISDTENGPGRFEGKGEAGPSSISDTEGKQEAGPSSISDTENGPGRETLHMYSGGEINEGQKDGGPPEETGRENLSEMPPHVNVENLATEPWVYSEDDNFHNWWERAEDYLLMYDAIKMGNCQHEPPGFAPLQGFEAVRFVFPDHSYPICSEAAEEYVDNLHTVPMDMDDATFDTSEYLSQLEPLEGSEAFDYEPFDFELEPLLEALLLSP